MLTRKALHLFLRSVENLEYGSFELCLPNGAAHHFQGRRPGPHGHLQLFSEDVIRRMTLGGDVAFAEDYRSGKWRSRDLPALIECGLRNQSHADRFIHGATLRKFFIGLSYLLRINSRRGSRRNIHAHYDLGNPFYALWLDRSMTYSSALFRRPDDTLEQAQQNKYDRILQRIGPSSGEILEIGCGWGGFAERAVTAGGHKVRGITLSQAQQDYAARRLRPYGARAEALLQDYRNSSGRYDAVVSIEMFEAVGERYWGAYFRKLKSLLRRNGRALIQAITIDEARFARYRRSGDVIRSYIFPGGMLPSLTRFTQEAQRAGLQIADRRHFGADYARTLHCWLQRFDARRREILELGFDESFIRLWRFYLASCMAAFRSARTDVMQVDLRHA